ncbi:MAG: hypothetical protein NW224_00220 [Leptolyngbyaceae cyanobacterium bins.302]|nr:hypothetical protein [Leptolyngbyaceae cyanobacterium bins.302]
MNKEEIILIVASVVGSAIAFAIPLISMLWKAFSLIADLRLQIVENRNQLVILTNKVDHFDDRWEGVSHQTNQKFDHFSTRVRGDVHQLNTQVRELQNFLSKTTNFEVRSQ